jgi:hypothetical protein
MLVEKRRNLGFDRLRQQGARAIAQDFCERILEASWLNQPRHVIVGHGISLLRWRSEVVKQPHDMPPSPIHAVTNFRA